MRNVVGALVAGVLLLAAAPPPASGAACAQACNDEVSACVAAECQGLTKRALRRCKKHNCRQPILQDCYRDLSVCGATSARPPQTGGGSSSSGGGW